MILSDPCSQPHQLRHLHGYSTEYCITNDNQEINKKRNNENMERDCSIQSNCFSKIELSLSLLDAKGKDENCNASNSSLLYFNL